MNMLHWLIFYLTYGRILIHSELYQDHLLFAVFSFMKHTESNAVQCAIYTIMCFYCLAFERCMKYWILIFFSILNTDA